MCKHLPLLRHDPTAHPIDRIRARLLNVEGRAAQVYWAGVRHILPADFAWPGRETRGARDPFNMALNYGYGVLYGQVERALVLAGLDAYAGFVHTDRPGKPSLTLDMIEERPDGERLALFGCLITEPHSQYRICGVPRIDQAR